MKKAMPQEIEVWYLIPYLRKKISIILSEKGMKQKEIARIFGVSEAAITNYVKEKRGSKVTLPSGSIKEIEKAAEKIIKGEDSTKTLYGLCEKFRDSRELCRIHRKFDKSVSEKCEVCFE